MKQSYIFLAEGFEEIEALSVIDIMRRAGMKISSVSITDDKTVKGAHGIPVVTDTTIDKVDFEAADWLICPGGMPGSTNLHECEQLSRALVAHAAKGGNIAAICAAPAVVLAPLGLLDGKDATCYPGFEKPCMEMGAVMHEAPVIETEHLITANGPAAAMRFALAIIKTGAGEQVASEVGSGLLFYPKSMNFYF